MKFKNISGIMTGFNRGEIPEFLVKQSILLIVLLKYFIHTLIMGPIVVS